MKTLNIRFEKIVGFIESSSSDPLNIVRQNSRTEIRRNFFSNRAVDKWNNLSSELKHCRSIEMFKNNVKVLLKTNSIWCQANLMIVRTRQPVRALSTFAFIYPNRGLGKFTSKQVNNFEPVNDFNDIRNHPLKILKNGIFWMIMKRW